MMTTSIEYVGNELELFAAAIRWKDYLRRALAPYIAGDVAEVGAGIGGTTQFLATLPGVRSWLAIEPDREMAAQLAAAVAGGNHPVGVHAGVLADLARAPSFDAVVYIDVLEHIEHDRAEVAQAWARLRPGGTIVALCPAWPALYTPFDRAIGHHRRYTISSLRRLAADGMTERAAFYLDSVGMLASLANKLALRQAMPTLAQVKLWDRWMVPASRVLDPLIGRTLGKSVVLVWRKG